MIFYKLSINIFVYLCVCYSNSDDKPNILFDINSRIIDKKSVYKIDGSRGVRHRRYSMCIGQVYVHLEIKWNISSTSVAS